MFTYYLQRLRPFSTGMSLYWDSLNFTIYIYSINISSCCLPFIHSMHSQTFFPSVVNTWIQQPLLSATYSFPVLSTATFIQLNGPSPCTAAKTAGECQVCIQYQDSVIFSITNVHLMYTFLFCFVFLSFYELLVPGERASVNCLEHPIQVGDAIARWSLDTCLLCNYSLKHVVQVGNECLPLLMALSVNANWPMHRVNLAPPSEKNLIWWSILVVAMIVYTPLQDTPLQFV